MPKTNIDSYGTWALPYLRPPDVPGASRCALEFKSQEVVTRKDFYKGKKRYRFNKWRPISPQFPRLHTSGLIFSADQDIPFSGIMSPWVIPYGSTGTVKLAFLPSILDEFDPATDTFEVGVGFQKYHAKYWGLAEGCELICKLTVKAGGVARTYSTLGNTVFDTRTYNLDRGVVFTLTVDPSMLGIIYDEFDPATSNATFSDWVTIPNPGAGIDPTDPSVDFDAYRYRVLFYIYVNSPKGSAAAHNTLLSTHIDLPDLKLTNTEKIWFLENPATFVPPFAPLRDTGLSMYAKPYKALIEDAQIMVGSPYTPPIWMRTIDFLMTGSIEPAIFTDPDGYTWLVCFESLNASSAMEVGDNGMGYELTMPIVVAH